MIWNYKQLKCTLTISYFKSGKKVIITFLTRYSVMIFYASMEIIANGEKMFDKIIRL